MSQAGSIPLYFERSYPSAFVVQCYPEPLQERVEGSRWIPQQPTIETELAAFFCIIGSLATII